MRKLTPEEIRWLYERITNLMGGDKWLTTELGIAVGRALGDIQAKPGDEECISVKESLQLIAHELQEQTFLMRQQLERALWREG